MENLLDPIGDCRKIEKGSLCGKDAPVFECDFGRVAFAICFDLNFDELRLKYVKAKPDLIIFSSMYHGGLMQAYWAYSCRAYFVGAIAGPISCWWQANEVEYLINDSRSKVLLVDPEYLSIAAEIADRAPLARCDARPAGTNGYLLHQRHLADLAEVAGPQRVEVGPRGHPPARGRQ